TDIQVPGRGPPVRRIIELIEKDCAADREPSSARQRDDRRALDITGGPGGGVRRSRSAARTVADIATPGAHADRCLIEERASTHVPVDDEFREGWSAAAEGDAALGEYESG